MSIALEVWGKYAMFTNPIFKTDRESYEVITPSAARGILESIYWNPGIQYVIDRIHVLNPIRYEEMCKNEVENLKVNPNDILKAAAGKAKWPQVRTDKNRIQRRNRILCDVRYVIEAHIINTPKAFADNTPLRAQEKFIKRVTTGRSFRDSCLGCREYAAYYDLCKEIPACHEELRGEQDLGLMLWGKDYSKPDIPPQMFHAIMKDGVIEVPTPGSAGVLV